MAEIMKRRISGKYRCLYHSFLKRNLRFPPRITEFLLFLDEFVSSPSSEKIEEDLVRRVLRQGDTVIEVGARTGAMTKVISCEVKDTGLVLSMEPNPHCMRKLLYNTRSLTNTRILNLAAGDQDTFAALNLDYISDPGASLVSNRAWRSVTVRVVKIDDLVKLMKLRKVDALIIDVEGFEDSVLKGALNTLEQVRVLIIEIHKSFNERMEDDVNHILNSRGFVLLEKNSYTPVTILNLYVRTPYNISRSIHSNLNKNN